MAKSKLKTNGVQCIGLIVNEIPGVESEIVLQFKTNTNKPALYELHACVDLESDQEFYDSEELEGFIGEVYCEKVKQFTPPTHVPVREVLASVEYGSHWQDFVDKYGADKHKDWLDSIPTAEYKKLDLVVYSDYRKGTLEHVPTVFHIGEGVLTFHKGNIIERDNGYVRLNMDLFKQI
jgi:hypothetical protein